MEYFTFKVEKFELVCSFTPYWNNDIFAKDIKITEIISVPDCYKSLSIDELQPIVDHFYSEELDEAAVCSVDEDYFKEESEEEEEDDWDTEYERRWEERTGR
jgi:hypothetical protein